MSDNKIKSGKRTIALKSEDNKKTFIKPKLKYIKPKLIKYGKINQLTTGTPIGTFLSPDDSEDPLDQDPRF